MTVTVSQRKLLEQTVTFHIIVTDKNSSKGVDSNSGKKMTKWRGVHDSESLPFIMGMSIQWITLLGVTLWMILIRGDLIEVLDNVYCVIS